MDQKGIAQLLFESYLQHGLNKSMRVADSELRNQGFEERSIRLAGQFGIHYGISVEQIDAMRLSVHISPKIPNNIPLPDSFEDRYSLRYYVSEGRVDGPSVSAYSDHPLSAMVNDVHDRLVHLGFIPSPMERQTLYRLQVR